MIFFFGTLYARVEFALDRLFIEFIVIATDIIVDFLDNCLTTYCLRHSTTLYYVFTQECLSLSILLRLNL